MPFANHTRRNYPRDNTVVRLFESQVRTTPYARAAVSGERACSYAELDKDVNRLAHHLQSRGVRAGGFIGICVERSIEMLTAVLAAMKIGAVYVPLDPAFPRDRLEFMASDCELSAVVVDSRTEAVFPTVARCIHLDQEQSDISRADDSCFESAPDPLDTAYLLYTSGSTGKPKGVRIPHRALVNLLCAMKFEPGISASDILLAVTTLSFDIAALELFLPLITGASVVIATGEEARDPRQLLRRMTLSGATIMQATPIQWRMLVEAGWKGTPAFRILCGGEPLRPQLAAALMKRGELWNMYGPTETTVWSSVCRIDSVDKPITVGRPIANTFFYVLDTERRPVASGDKGELYISGDGVADGYLNRPELTAERFPADPFQNVEGARMYRTGDVATMAEDGTTSIFGRTDAQVKVRGFRIELGEVESVLARCPLVRENAVVVREEASGECALAAYFVAIPEISNAVAEVRRFLQGRIPDYMIPGHVVCLDRMPLLPNGKIDRRSLPSLRDVLIEEPRQIQAGRDELEAKLLKIWESVLNLPRLSRDSNFFELGGRSILAVRLFTQIEKQLGHVFPLATLFQAPTVAELAAVIRDKGWCPPWASLVPIRPHGSRPPIFLVHAIGGNILNFHAFAARFDLDQPIYGLQARGLDGKEAPHTTVEDMAADYIRSIKSVQPSGPYRLGGFSAGGVVAFEMARQLLERGEDTEVLALLDTQIGGLAGPSRHASARNTLGRWRRMLVFNLRYALRTGLKGFAGHKIRNWRMRLRIRATAMGVGRLNAEEAFLAALRQYKAEPYDGSAVLFRARNELVKYPDPTFGWKPLIRGTLHISEVAGDHDTLLDEPYIGALASELNQLLTCTPEKQEASVSR